MSMQLMTSGFQARPNDTVDVGLFIRTLKRRAVTIFICTGIAAAAALVHVLFATPQFTAQGTLYLGDTQTSQTAGGANGNDLNLSAYSTQSDVETQVELLSTGVLIQNAVLETGLNANIRLAGTPPLTFWRWRAFGGGSTQYFEPGPQSLQVIDATTPGRFKVVTGPDNTYKLYERGGLFSTGRLVLTGMIGEPATANGISLTVQAASPDLQDSKNFHIDPGKSYDLDITPPDALTDSLLNGGYTATAGGSQLQPTKLAFLQFRWANPYQAQLFVNQLMQDYIATQLAWKTESASVTANFVSGQLTKVSGQLSKADKALADYQAQTGVVDPQQAAQAAVTRMTQLQTEESAVELQRDALRQLNATLNDKESGFNPYLISQANDTVLAAMTTSLSEAEVKARQLQMEYTSNSQDLQVQEAQVAQLRSAIKETVRNDLKAADSSLSNLQSFIAQYREEIHSEPAEALQVSSLSRSSKLLGQLYETLSEKAEQAQISKAATIIETRVVTPASLPLGASSPKAVITVLAGAIGGFIAGILLVLGQRNFSGRFESEEQIRLAVSQPVYGAVPHQAQPLLGHGMFGPDRLNPFSEAFKLIKRNIYKHSVNDRAAVVLVISASKEDGKTTVATNIAKSLADDGKRTVLVDCDVYLSRIQGMPGFAGAPGLSDWMATGRRPPFKEWPDMQFTILPAGTLLTPRSERLGDPAFATVMQALSEEFDYIVLDSPPLPIVSDGLTLGGFADLILSVVSVANTGRRAFAQHNELIEALGKPHGIIINGADNIDYEASEAYFLGPTSRWNKFTGWFRVG